MAARIPTLDSVPGRTQVASTPRAGGSLPQGIDTSQSSATANMVAKRFAEEEEANSKAALNEYHAEARRASMAVLGELTQRQGRDAIGVESEAQELIRERLGKIRESKLGTTGLQRRSGAIDAGITSELSGRLAVHEAAETKKWRINSATSSNRELVNAAAMDADDASFDAHLNLIGATSGVLSRETGEDEQQTIRQWQTQAIAARIETITSDPNSDPRDAKKILDKYEKLLTPEARIKLTKAVETASLVRDADENAYDMLDKKKMSVSEATQAIDAEEGTPPQVKEAKKNAVLRLANSRASAVRATETASANALYQYAEENGIEPWQALQRNPQLAKGMNPNTVRSIQRQNIHFAAREAAHAGYLQARAASDFARRSWEMAAKDFIGTKYEDFYENLFGGGPIGDYSESKAFIERTSRRGSELQRQALDMLKKRLNAGNLDGRGGGAHSDPEKAALFKNLKEITKLDTQEILSNDPHISGLETDPQKIASARVTEAALRTTSEWVASETKARGRAPSNEEQKIYHANQVRHMLKKRGNLYNYQAHAYAANDEVSNVRVKITDESVTPMNERLTILAALNLLRTQSGQPPMEADDPLYEKILFGFDSGSDGLVEYHMRENGIDPDAYRAAAFAILGGGDLTEDIIDVISQSNALLTRARERAEQQSLPMAFDEQSFIGQPY